MYSNVWSMGGAGGSAASLYEPGLDNLPSHEIRNDQGRAVPSLAVYSLKSIACQTTVKLLDKNTIDALSGY